MLYIYSIFVKIDGKSKQNFYDNCPDIGRIWVTRKKCMDIQRANKLKHQNA